ncbi:MAG: hypothetical protein HY590_04265 [Candidatus Omnitrophica bacterium]|nr:hypothetical protein [Candidatus Omnitrophota bacterium]
MGNASLTMQQKRVYEFVKEYILTNKRPPYIREIQGGCGSISYKAALDKLVALERKGYIRRAPNKHRGIVLEEELSLGREAS